MDAPRIEKLGLEVQLACNAEENDSHALVTAGAWWDSAIVSNYALGVVVEPFTTVTACSVAGSWNLYTCFLVVAVGEPVSAVTPVDSGTEPHRTVRSPVSCCDRCLSAT